MLRVGLTGGLGSGKSTAGAMLARRGAHLLQADEIGREMMRPGQPVYGAILERFGPGVVRADGELDRAELARLAFAGGRLEELNAIVHPAVIGRQMEVAEEIGSREPEAVVVVESALIFETKHGGEEGWRRRFDRVIVLVAAEDRKIARFADRSMGGKGGAEARAALETEARRRLAQQMPDERKSAAADFVLTNDGTLGELELQVDALWPVLAAEAREQQRR